MKLLALALALALAPFARADGPGKTISSSPGIVFGGAPAPLAIPVVAVGNGVAASSSDDGATWVARTIGAGDYRRVAWNGSVFVAVGSAGVASISSDGKTW